MTIFASYLELTDKRSILYLSENGAEMTTFASYLEFTKNPVSGTISALITL